jgi:nucleoid DNA-binding protein
LRPVKRKVIIEKTANKLELPPELVEDIVSHYYTTLRKEMSYGNLHAITVPNLGTFVVKYKSLQIKIKNYKQKLLTHTDEISMITFENKMMVQSELDRFHTMLGVMEGEKEKKQKIRQSRINNENARTNLEK